LAAPAISHLIGTTGLIVLIFIMPLFYGTIASNIEVDVIQRELKEIVDYTSNTIENLYFLVNSTHSNVSIEKELVYLPSVVEDSQYILQIVDQDGIFTQLRASLKDDPSVEVFSWVIPGLYVDKQQNIPIESGDYSVKVGCTRNDSGIYVWITYA
jgi:hypothetical protein